jgi:hypothetical protein
MAIQSKPVAAAAAAAKIRKPGKLTQALKNETCGPADWFRKTN